jgi:hypothetical protein
MINGKTKVSDFYTPAKSIFLVKNHGQICLSHDFKDFQVSGNLQGRPLWVP